MYFFGSVQSVVPQQKSRQSLAKGKICCSDQTYCGHGIGLMKMIEASHKTNIGQNNH
jgi:hypothetical protein